MKSLQLYVSVEKSDLNACGKKRVGLGMDVGKRARKRGSMYKYFITAKMDSRQWE